MKVPNYVWQSVDRLAALNAQIQAAGDEASEQVISEYRDRLEFVRDAVAPIVVKLVAAGLLSVDIAVEDGDSIEYTTTREHFTTGKNPKWQKLTTTEKYSSLDFTPERVWVDGNITLSGRFEGTGTLVKPARTKTKSRAKAAAAGK